VRDMDGRISFWSRRAGVLYGKTHLNCCRPNLRADLAHRRHAAAPGQWEGEATDDRLLFLTERLAISTTVGASGGELEKSLRRSPRQPTPTPMLTPPRSPAPGQSLVWRLLTTLSCPCRLRPTLVSSQLSGLGGINALFGKIPGQSGNCIGGIDAPDQGEIHFDGRDNITALKHGLVAEGSEGE